MKIDSTEKRCVKCGALKPASDPPDTKLCYDCACEVFIRYGNPESLAKEGEV